MVTESTREPAPVVVPKRNVAMAPYPTVPELAELPSYTAALQHPQMYPAVSGGQLQHSHSATAIPVSFLFIFLVSIFFFRKKRVSPHQLNESEFEKEKLLQCIHQSLIMRETSMD